MRITFYKHYNDAVPEAGEPVSGALATLNAETFAFSLAAVSAIRKQIEAEINSHLDAAACEIAPHIDSLSITNERETDISYSLRFYDCKTKAFVDFWEPSRMHRLLGLFEHDGEIVLPFNPVAILRNPKSFRDAVFCQLFLFILFYSNEGGAFRKLIQKHKSFQQDIKTHAHKFIESMYKFSGRRMSPRDVFLDGEMQAYNCELSHHKDFSPLKEAFAKFGDELFRRFRTGDRDSVTEEFLRSKRNYQ